MTGNIRALDLTLLLAFDALFEERSVTRAADRLALSQPAVSGILNRLRAQFGDDLFVRSSHGVVPTPRAEAMSGQVKHIIRSTQALFETEAFDPSRSAFDIRFSATDYINRALLSALIPELIRQAPKARISVTQLQSGRLRNTELLSDIDILFSTYDPYSADPEGQYLFRDSMVCVSSYRHHEHGQYVSLPELCDLTHIVGQKVLRSAVSGRISTIFREHGLERNVQLDVPDFATVFRLMETCELVAVLPAKLAAQHAAKLKQLRVDIDIPAASIFARWHPRLENEPRHRWLRNVVEAVAAEL